MGVTNRLVKFNEPSAKKRLGQHFLRDRGVIDRIVRWIQPGREDLFLDIGAGDGALSQSLAPLVSRLLAVELDDECVPYLASALSGFPSATVIHGDILRLDLPHLLAPYLAPDTRLRIAGNLPYNIATVIIEKMLRLELPISDMRFMVQLEVAERITAGPGTRDYGYFSLLCQHFSATQFGFKVSSGCFVPRPKVSSAMVSFQLKPKTWVPSLESDFTALGKAAFAHRRKTLANSLSRHPVLGSMASRLLESAGVDGSKRAEQLTVSEYERLAQTYHSMRTADGGR